jgi:hypothetical protein
MDGIIRSADETSWKLTIAFMGGLLYLWGWLLVNVPELQRIAVVYEFMTFLAVMIGGLAHVGARHFGVLGFPSLKEIPTTTAVGATVGLLWLIIGGQIARLAGMQATSIACTCGSPKSMSSGTCGALQLNQRLLRECNC